LGKISFKIVIGTKSKCFIGIVNLKSSHERTYSLMKQERDNYNLAINTARFRQSRVTSREKKTKNFSGVYRHAWCVWPAYSLFLQGDSPTSTHKYLLFSKTKLMIRSKNKIQCFTNPQDVSIHKTALQGARPTENISVFHVKQFDAMQVRRLFSG